MKTPGLMAIDGRLGVSGTPVKFANRRWIRVRRIWRRDACASRLVPRLARPCDLRIPGRGKQFAARSFVTPAGQAERATPGGPSVDALPSDEEALISLASIDKPKVEALAKLGVTDMKEFLQKQLVV